MHERRLSQDWSFPEIGKKGLKMCEQDEAQALISMSGPAEGEVSYATQPIASTTLMRDNAVPL